MPTNQELSIILRLRDEVTRRLQQIQGRLQGFAARFRQNWLAITAAITAAIFAIQRAWQAINIAVQAEQQAEAFKQLAASYGANADELLAELRRVSVGAVSTAELIQAAGKAILLGLAPEQLPELLEIARASARVTGDTMTKAFDDIATGIARQSRLILDNLGIVIRAGDVYRTYAESLGKSAEELTDAEKRQAFLNAVLEAGRDTLARVNTELVTNAERIQQAKVLWREFAEFIGRILTALVNLVASGFLTIVSTIQKALTALLRLAVQGMRRVAEMAEALERLPLVGERIQGLNETLQGTADRMGSAAFEIEQARQTTEQWAEDFAAGAGSILGLIEGPVTQGFRNLQGEVAASADQARRVLIDWKQFVTGAVQDLANAMSSAMSEFFFKVFTGELRNTREILVDFGRTILRIFAELLARIIVIRTLLFAFPGIGPFLGLAHGGGAVQTRHAGGRIQRFQAGGAVPILAEEGEFIINRQSTARNRSLLERINRGEPMEDAGGAQAPVVVFQINAIDPQTGAEFLLRNANVIAEAVTREILQNNVPLRRIQRRFA